jgi:GNAT superfamily N-acetyltransferase
MDDLPIYVFLDGDEPVGQLGILPCPTMLKGERVRNGWCVDFYVMKRAQRGGVGGKLLKAAYADFSLLSTLGQSDLAYNFFSKMGGVIMGP